MLVRTFEKVINNLNVAPLDKKNYYFLWRSISEKVKMYQTKIVKILE